MAWFKEKTQHVAARIAALEALVWVCIYGGLLALVLGWFVSHTQGANAAWLYAGGTVAVLVGCILIWLRSTIDHRAHNTTPGDSQ